MNKKLITFLFSVNTLLTVSSITLGVNIPPAPGQTGGPALVNDPSDFINRVLNFLYPVFFGFSIVMFLVAAYMFLTAQGAPEALEKARSALIWGVVGVVLGIASISIPFIIIKLGFA